MKTGYLTTIHADVRQGKTLMMMDHIRAALNAGQVVWMNGRTYTNESELSDAQLAMTTAVSSLQNKKAGRS